MGSRLIPSGLIAAVVALGPLSAQEAPAPLPEPHPDLPESFRQLIPRGRSPAIDEPRFVRAAEAAIADDAWVLGVVIAGQAKAYSLNLLNRHEVVNDRFGDLPIAAVW